MTVRAVAAAVFGFALFGMIGTAQAAGCPGNPDALGTSRVITIDPAQYPGVGSIQYPETLPLEDKEVVLTFDDGPLPPYTARILDILAAECVKANYFIIGRMARGYPDLLKRVYAEGHVIGTHSENHPLKFNHMTRQAVETEVERGISSVTGVLGDVRAVAPFFRIPGLLRTKEVDALLQSHGLVSWSADVTADDWKHIQASEVVRRAMSRLESKGKGIILLHDIQPATVLALPNLLKELKTHGYRIVQVKPAATPPAPLVASKQPAAQPAKPQPAATPLPAVAATAQAAAVPLPQPRAIDTIARAQPATEHAALPLSTVLKPSHSVGRAAKVMRHAHLRSDMKARTTTATAVVLTQSAVY